MSGERTYGTSQERSTLERAVVIASVLVIGLIVGVLVWAEATGSDDPPTIRAEVVELRVVDGDHVVSVEVRNVGGRTAADVVVYAEVGTGPTSTTAEQTIDFLFAGDHQMVTFVFSEDPGSEGVDVGVQAYIEP